MTLEELNMKKTLIAGMLAAAPFATALADNNIGCGLGTQVWEGQAGLLPKVLGATTNGTFGNQTFGITSGTLGCSSDGVVTASARMQHYASANLDQLAQDIARGKGEALDQLATLYGMDSAAKAEFTQLTKANFGEIFAQDHTTAKDVLAAINTLMSQHAKLSSYAA